MCLAKRVLDRIDLGGALQQALDLACGQSDAGKRLFFSGFRFRFRARFRLVVPIIVLLHGRRFALGAAD